MNNPYTPSAQKEIDSAENKLGDAIKSLKAQSRDPEIEIIPEPNDDVEIELSTGREIPTKEPRRSEFVKTDDPKVMDRINDLYGQVKQSDKRNQMILEHNKMLEDKLAEYAEKANKIERQSRDTASDKVEGELKARLRTAREEHDLDTIEQIEDKLLDLRLERRISDKIQKQETPVIRQSPAQQQFEKQLVHNAAYIENLSQERDQQGNLLRPYLYDWHPDNKKAVELFTSIPREFEAAGKAVDLKTVIDVLDERIKGKKPKPSSSVLSGEGDEIGERKTVKLTQQEIYIAKQLGLKPEAYARQKQLIGS